MSYFQSLLFPSSIAPYTSSPPNCLTFMSSSPSFVTLNPLYVLTRRFSKDTEVIDSSVPEFLQQALVNWAQVISVIGLCIWSTYYFLIVIIPLSYLFYRLYLNFGSVQRDLKRYVCIYVFIWINISISVNILMYEI